MRLDQLTVEGFRCFKRLHLQRLGRVTLVTGQNSVGKSYLLEAIELLVAGDPFEVLYRQMSLRDGLRAEQTDAAAATAVDAHIALAGLFWDWPEEVVGRSLTVSAPSRQVRVSVVPGPSSPNDSQSPNPPEGWEAASSVDISRNGEMLGRLDAARFVLGLPSLRRGTRPDPATVPLLRWSLGAVEYARLARLYDELVLLPTERQVLEALRLVHAGITGIAFRESPRGARRPFVKLSSLSRVVPLNSLGEGLSRLLAIAVGLASVPGGVLLLDEVETGLHYSVQPALWRMVFETARELNVQVVATTHSLDCIRGFQAAALADPQAEGALVRLQRRGEAVEATAFSETELRDAMAADLEVRG
ncbi:MAG: AAA family ATPase [Fimbriimonadaceae bacterium]|nr:AAA family ATPase [Fimbriimonadaceae bacterium]